ncbi:MAG: hypothetical protein ACYDBQ_08155 [Thermoplasmatota archaeon]
MLSDWVTWVVVLHALAAAGWAGGSFFLGGAVGPALRRAGAAGEGFWAAVAKRGGLRRFFLAVAGVTVLTGGFLYGQTGIAQAPWDGGNLWLTLGAFAGVAAFGVALVSAFTVERAMGRVSSTSAPGSWESLQKRFLALNGASSGLLALAFVGMLLAHLA